MKRLLIVALAMTMALVFTTLCLAGQMGGKKDAMMTDKMVSGSGIWKSITGKNHYTRWDLIPGTTKMQKGAEPHGAFVTIYANKLANNSIRMKKGEYSDGSIVIKENYMPDKTLAAVTVMQKSNGFDPEGGDWYWVKFQPGGKVDAEGKVGGCINCHRKAADRDWVFTGEIR